jgi:methylmalonyl-CoA mutase
MRLLLARIGEVAGLTLAPHIHVETAWRMLSARDPEMNILRGTSAAFAAAVGGANSITVLPFDALARKINNQRRRLARNTQVILAEEAHLFRVADPAAGSGAIEALTDSLAEAAWKRFQRIEAAGGIVAAIAEGSLLRDVAEAREARIARAASGETKIVGANAYAAGETASANVRRMPAGPGARLVFKRVAEIFEAGAE